MLIENELLSFNCWKMTLWPDWLQFSCWEDLSKNFIAKKLYKGTDKIIGFHPTNQNTYFLHSFYSDNKIITVFGRPAICNLIGWAKNSCLFSSLSGFCGFLGHFGMEMLANLRICHLICKGKVNFVAIWFVVDPSKP